MKENDSYYTISNVSEGTYKEKGSKFLAFAFPVETEEEIDLQRTAIKKKHHDARHCVYAFRLGSKGERMHASDDGEPAHSSGPPVLGKIRSYDLTNILVIVVRYFGGTKLGIPGLIRAYGSAAEDALQKAQIIKKIKKKDLQLQFPYEEAHTIMQWIKAQNAEIIWQEWDSDCRMQLLLSESQYKKIKEIALHKGQIKILPDNSPK
ncbi:MAG: YigZ family protein [Bacteroidia bacterium]|nr:MAG: YigZ family protein [Bacteroidia bacterium]